MVDFCSASCAGTTGHLTRMFFQNRRENSSESGSIDYYTAEDTTRQPGLHLELLLSPCPAWLEHHTLHSAQGHRSDPPCWGRKLPAQPSQISAILIPAAHLYPSVKRQFSWGHVSRAREKMWVYRSSMHFKISWSYFIDIRDHFYDSMILWSFVQWGETAFIDKDRNPLYSLCSRYIFGSDGSANILISTEPSVDELKDINYSKMEMNSICYWQLDN